MTREEAVKLLKSKMDGHIDTSYEWAETVRMAIRALEKERKTGHWVNGEYCSECGCDVPAYIVDWKWEKNMNAKYCPECGTKMEVGNERT